MKVDVMTVLVDLDGRPVGTGMVPVRVLSEALAALRGGNGEQAEAILSKALAPGGEPATVRSVLCDALLASYQDEASLPGTKKMERWALASKVHAEADPDLTSQEVTLAKEMVAKAFAPLVVGQVWKLLDPACVNAK